MKGFLPLVLPGEPTSFTCSQDHSGKTTAPVSQFSRQHVIEPVLQYRKRYPHWLYNCSNNSCIALYTKLSHTVRLHGAAKGSTATLASQNRGQSGSRESHVPLHHSLPLEYQFSLCTNKLALLIPPVSELRQSFSPGVLESKASGCGHGVNSTKRELGSTSSNALQPATPQHP